MKYLFLTFLFALAFSKNSLTQTCNCDSLAESRKSNWPKWVKNSDTIKVVQVVKIGLIKTEKRKQQLLKSVTDDTSWVSFPASGKTVTVRLGRLDTLAGRMFRLPDTNIDSSRAQLNMLPGESGPMRTVSFATKNNQFRFLNENIAVGDEYYEIYFLVGKTLFMSPSICSKKFCTIMDNIIYNLFITK